MDYTSNQSIHSNDTDKASEVEELNGLLRGEISALETYTSALKDVEKNEDTERLVRIRDNHEGNVSKLRSMIEKLGGAPDKSSGTWGSVTQTIQKAANLFGESTALTSLRTGEKLGISMYERAMNSGNLSPDSHNLVRKDLLPHCENNIATLDSMLQRH